MVVEGKTNVLEHLHHEYGSYVNILNTIRQVHSCQLDQDKHQKCFQEHYPADFSPGPVLAQKEHHILLSPQHQDPLFKYYDLHHDGGCACECKHQSRSSKATHQVGKRYCRHQAGNKLELIIRQHIKGIYINVLIFYWVV